MEIVLIMYLNGAFTKRPISRYNFDTKEWTDNKNPICWHGGLFEYNDNILTGRYFNQCHLLPYKINKGWTPRPTITIDCVEIEIAPDNWIMAVDANNTNLLLLNAYKMTASDYTHLFGYLNPYYRSAYNVSKRRK